MNMIMPISELRATLADMLALISQHPTLSATRRRDLTSAVNTVARVLNRRPEEIPADAPDLRRRLSHVHARLTMQELAYGGLSSRAEARLQELIEEEDRRVNGKGPVRRNDRPTIGTRLVREWKGVEHCATVLEDGFEYQGRRYKSLSAIARAVTGTRWNGPLFWGLRNHRGPQ